MTRGSHSLSVLATYTAALMSPTTLIVVRVMSRIRSTPMINAIVSGSTFTAAGTPINNGKEAPGDPAAPTAPAPARVQDARRSGTARRKHQTLPQENARRAYQHDE